MQTLASSIQEQFNVNPNKFDTYEEIKVNPSQLYTSRIQASSVHKEEIRLTFVSSINRVKVRLTTASSVH